MVAGAKPCRFNSDKNERHAIGFAQTDNALGLVVSKNALRNLAYHGIGLAGALLENVVYDTRGHSLLLWDGKEWNNKVELNLVARNQNEGGDDAGFLIRSLRNVIVGNVVAGSYNRGFSFQIEGSIKELSRSGLPGGNPGPRKEIGGNVRDNVTHTCHGYGFTLSRWTNNNGSSLPFTGEPPTSTATIPLRPKLRLAQLLTSWYAS